MHFSIYCGLSFMCVTLLIFLPAQGRLQYVTPESPDVIPVIPACCTNVSKAPILEKISTCFEQKADKFSYCKIHAYIFWTVSKKYFCVDPTARWLHERLQKLKKNGIFCQVL